MSGKDQVFDDAGKRLAEELSMILGQPMRKVAAAQGTPEEGKRSFAKKKKGFTKVSEMPLRALLEHPDFVRGMQEEMESLRSIWEPVVESFISQQLGE